MGHQDCSKCNYRIFDTSVIIAKLQKIYLAPYFTTEVREIMALHECHIDVQMGKGS
jgi:hypothetical protein